MRTAEEPVKRQELNSPFFALGSNLPDAQAPFGIGGNLVFIDVKEICGSRRLLLQQTGQFVSQCFGLFGGKINHSITDAILS